MPRLLAMICLLAAMAMGGANVPFGKAIVSELPVEAFMLIRFALATVVLAMLVPLEAGPSLAALSWRGWAGVLALAVFGSVLFTAFLLSGLQRTSAVDAGIITASLPAVVVAMGAALGDRPRPGEVAMVVLAVAGVALIQVTALERATATLAGNLLVGLAVLCEATFVLVSRRMGQLIRPVRLSFAVAGVSLVVCLPLLATGLPSFDPAAVKPDIWLLVVWYSLSASILATVLWYLGAPYLPTWAAGLATAALPATALALAVFWLGERVTAVQLLGAAMVVLAIVAGTLSQRQARP